MASKPARRGGVVLLRLLDVLCFAVLVAAVAAGVVVVVVLARGAHPRVSFPVGFAVCGGSGGEDATGPARVMDAGGQLSVAASPELVVMALAFAVVGLGLVLAVLRQVRALLTAAIAGAPFGGGSARRVRLIGVAIICGELIRALAVLVGSWWARAHVHVPGLSFRASFPLQLGVLGIGVLVVALAEVFRVGAALQQEQDLTV